MGDEEFGMGPQVCAIEDADRRCDEGGARKRIQRWCVIEPVVTGLHAARVSDVLIDGVGDVLIDGVGRVFRSAAVRRQRALRPVVPFTPSMAARPGEIVQMTPPPEAGCRCSLHQLRQLPIALGPVHDETLGSYLHRLAVANNRPAGFLARLLGPLPPEFSPLSNTTAGWNPHAPDRLATLSVLEGGRARAHGERCASIRPACTLRCPASPTPPGSSE